MDPDSLRRLWPEIEPLLDQLLDLPEPDRAAWLERELADSPEKRQLLEGLLRADRDSAALMAEPAALPADAFASLATPPLAVGEHIGPYVIRQELGRGGMGTVLLADRDDGQFEQRVAIKMVRADNWDPAAVERFSLERRILARLQHPHIARLLDGGMLENGSPFLVMEYVEGQPLTEWCDAHALHRRARVQLFLQVCDAIEYAHQQLVVHRDLKPANILVTEQGEVKLLDFGIAKLLEPNVEADMLGTRTRMFTPAYAAPEQYLGAPMTVATDGYQLGLVLYELVAGERAHQDAATTPLSHQRAVLETDPRLPSLARARHSTERSGLDDDLDAILMKALEREPEHRYPTVEALRRDLSDMLADRPVLARNPTLSYRARKYVRRNRVGVVGASLVLISLVVGVAGVLLQARVAARERDLARASERRATAINDFVLRELLEAPMPERTLGRPLTVAEVLGNASRAIGHAFPDEPEIGAGVRMTLARSYQALGLADSARANASAALDILTRHRPPEARDRLEARAIVADLELDRGRFVEGQQLFEALAQDQARVLGPRAPETLRSRAQIGRALAEQRQLMAADSLLRGALEQIPDATGTQWRLAAEMRGWLASVRIQQSRPREAVGLLRETLALERKQLGSEHPLVISTLRKLADALESDLQRTEAGAVLEEAVQLSTRVNGAGHPATADAYMGLARNLDNRLDHEAALAANSRGLEIDRHALGVEHPKTLRLLRNQAVLLRGLGRYREAGPVYEEVYAVLQRTLGEEHPQTLEALQGLVYLRLDEQRTGDARVLARRILGTYERMAGRPQPDATTLADHALYLIEAAPEDIRDPGRAVTVAQRAVALTKGQDFYALRALGFARAAAADTAGAIRDLRRALLLPEGLRSWTSEDLLVELMATSASPDTLESVLRQRLAQIRAVRGAEDRYAAKTLRHLSRLAGRLKRTVEAEQLSHEVLMQLLKTLPESHWEVGRAKSEWGGLRTPRGASVETESLLVQGYRTLAGDPEVGNLQLESARTRLVDYFASTGRAALASQWRRRGMPQSATDR